METLRDYRLTILGDVTYPLRLVELQGCMSSWAKFLSTSWWLHSTWKPRPLPSEELNVNSVLLGLISRQLLFGSTIRLTSVSAF